MLSPSARRAPGAVATQSTSPLRWTSARPVTALTTAVPGRVWARAPAPRRIVRPATRMANRVTRNRWKAMAAPPAGTGPLGAVSFRGGAGLGQDSDAHHLLRLVVRDLEVRSPNGGDGGLRG